MSPEIVNGCILLMSTNCVVRRILNKIHDVKFFAILADKRHAKQRAPHNMHSLGGRSTQYPRGHHLAIVHVEQSNAKSLYLATKYVHIRCSLPLWRGRGQWFDGAANLMGDLRGLATRV